MFNKKQTKITPEVLLERRLELAHELFYKLDGAPLAKRNAFAWAGSDNFYEEYDKRKEANDMLVEKKHLMALNTFMQINVPPPRSHIDAWKLADEFYEGYRVREKMTKLGGTWTQAKSEHK